MITLCYKGTETGDGDMAETTVNDPDLLRVGLMLAWGVSVAIVFIHASYNEQNVLAWTLVALIPGFGFLIYFIAYYVHGLGDTARRAKRKEQRRWEFELTQKGKPRDPNEPVEEPGASRKIITESPLSKDIDE